MKFSVKIAISLTVLLALTFQASAIPKKSEIGSRSGLLQELKRRKVSSVDDLFGCFQEHPWGTLWGDLGGAKNGVKIRYLYSKKWGWIDLKHFSAGAWANSVTGVSGQRVLKKGEEVECKQEACHSDSRWNYEDLISNLLGTYFYEYYRNRLLGHFKPIMSNGKRSSFTDILSDYLSELGFVDDPEKNAPNMGMIDESPVILDIWQNRKYQALFTLAERKDYHSLDYSILNYLKLYLTEACGTCTQCVGTDPDYVHFPEVQKASQNFNSVWSEFLKK